jgi:hypothetical protein
VRGPGEHRAALRAQCEGGVHRTVPGGRPRGAGSGRRRTPGSSARARSRRA